jgi:hypothetical protein
MGEMKNAHKILIGKPERKNHSEDQGVDGRIILKCTVKEYNVRVWTVSIWLRTWTSGGLL